MKRNRTDNKISGIHRYTGAAFAAYGSVVEILSNHIPIMSAVLLVSGLTGIVISPAIAIVVVLSILGISAGLGGYYFFKFLKDTKKINNDLNDLKSHNQKLEEAKDDINKATLAQGMLKQQAKDLGISDAEINNILEEAKSASKKQLKDVEQIKRPGRLARAWDALLLCLKGVTSIGGVIACIALIKGIPVFQLGIVAAFTATLGVSGPVGIAIVAAISIIVIVSLLVYRFYFDKEKRMSKTKTKKSNCEIMLQNQDVELSNIKDSNFALQSRINEALSSGQQRNPVIRPMTRSYSSSSNSSDGIRPSTLDAPNTPRTSNTPSTSSNRETSSRRNHGYVRLGSTN